MTLTSTKTKAAKTTKTTNPTPSVPGMPFTAPPALPKPSGYPIPAEVDTTLSTILSWRRAYRSAHGTAFAQWLTAHIHQLTGVKPYVMSSEANLVVDIPLPDGKPSTTLFSSHIDTCHADRAGVSQRQEIAYDGQRGEIILKVGQPGDCLGADDGAGVWLMLEMIAAKVPGTYIFHQGEERGCIGSRAMAAEKRQWLEKFDLAVAFDRRGFTEVITHQTGRRCASDKCAQALCAQLNAHGLKGMVPSDRGAYTDTAQYREIIPECFNIAVGYFQNHGPNEYVDYAYLSALRGALLKVDWEALPVDRDPKVEARYTYTPPKSVAPPKPAAGKPNIYDPVAVLSQMSIEEMEDYFAQLPAAAAEDVHDLLLELVRTRAERDYYKRRGGF